MVFTRLFQGFPKLPYRLKIIPEKRLALFTFSGLLTASEGRAAFVEYTDHKLFCPTYSMLSDARGVSGIDASFPDVFAKTVSLGSRLRIFTRPVLSIVLVRTEVQFGYARMLEQVLDAASLIHLHVVTDEAEALRLAGLTEDSFDQLPLA
jgi:hypothetical protein